MKRSERALLDGQALSFERLVQGPQALDRVLTHRNIRYERCPRPVSREGALERDPTQSGQIRPKCTTGASEERRLAWETCLETPACERAGLGRDVRGKLQISPPRYRFKTATACRNSCMWIHDRLTA